MNAGDRDIAYRAAIANILHGIGIKFRHLLAG